MNDNRLPISGNVVRFRPLTGADEVLLWEAGVPAERGMDSSALLSLAVTLAERLTERADGGRWEIASLPLGDLDALLLLLRRAYLGDLIRAETRCAAAGCGAKMDVAFGVTEYLSSQRPEAVRGVVAGSGAAGWFELSGKGAGRIQFRPPTVGDARAIAGEREPETALYRRCVRWAGATLDGEDSSETAIPAGARRKIEAALTALAPTLDNTLEGVCPECGAAAAMGFQPRAYVLQELSGYARFVVEEVHRIAAAYHWSETEILALPRSRRQAYAERIREMQSGVA